MTTPVTAADLPRMLRAASSSFLVEFWHLITDPALSTADVVRLIVDQSGYEEKGTMNRVRAARRILQAGLARDALKLIANAQTGLPTTRDRALVLYHSGDGALAPGEFSIDRTKRRPQPNDPTASKPKRTYSQHSQRDRRPAPLDWYRAADGVLCADVQSPMAGAVSLTVERSRLSFRGEAHGFLAVLLHKTQAFPSEAEAQTAIAQWWANVKA